MKDETLKESIYKKFKDKIKENINITEKGKEKAKFEIVHFSEVYNIPKGRVKMNLTIKDKEWITSAIVAGVTEGIKPLDTKVNGFIKEQKVFNSKVEGFMEEQKVFNNKQELFNSKVEGFMEEQKVFNKNHKH